MKTESYPAGVIPGPIVLFGSGETSPSGRRIFNLMLRKLPPDPRVALLETPAGFELNSAQVIGRVADFLRKNIPDYSAQITTIPARQRGTPFSPDEVKVVEPLLEADMIFMGPGSPTYAVRQLRDSLAWYMLLARHRLGATIALASAATLAVSRYVLPVYEIYKVGEDLHWKPGLDLFGLYGLPLIFIPHWNNNDGGEELDTRRCFMGQARFARLMEMLPAHLTVLGIDEKTALIMDFPEGICRIVGQGGVTLLHTGHQHPDAAKLKNNPALEQIAEQRDAHVHQYKDGDIFPLAEWHSGGQEHRSAQDYRMQLPDLGIGLPPEIWQQALAAQKRMETIRQQKVTVIEMPSQEVQTLAEERQRARDRKDWAAADRLRTQITNLGWQVEDTLDAPRLKRI